eukprot:TRINITY_DN18982_c0_g1_i1.p1 TRINITY_DN18982_c0_g1~~TRINITY_DN18982_c0_g1_i1.p1  ORF type:complete len:623 (-),score=132.90 TRINITY_DN18982_c0_g1_i1:156-2024(-)
MPALPAATAIPEEDEGDIWSEPDQHGLPDRPVGSKESGNSEASSGSASSGKHKHVAGAKTAAPGGDHKAARGRQTRRSTAGVPAPIKLDDNVMDPRLATSKAGQVLSAMNLDPEEFTGWRRTMHKIISWPGFDTGIGLIIALNAFTIGLETQTKATIPIGCTEECECKDQVDPTLTCELPPPILQDFDVAFFVIYLIELLLRFGTYGPQSLRSHWVKFDLFLVVSSATDFILKAFADSDELKKLMLVRMLRLFRLARAVRLMVQFQTLWKLVQGLYGCLNTLLWTFLLVTVLQYVFAVTGMETIQVMPELPLDDPYNIAVMDNFHDVLDCMLFQLQTFSFDSAGSVYRPLAKQQPLTIVYFVVTFLLMSIALMNLVTAVMVNSSMDQAAEDKDAMKAWQQAEKAKELESLKQMFLELDEDGSGELSMDEIDSAPEDAQDCLKTIAATDNLQALFEMLDYDGGGTLGVEEFCNGVFKATTCAPGMMELGRMVQQCTQIHQDSKEAMEILKDKDKGIYDFIRRGTGGGGGGGDGGGGSGGGRGGGGVNVEQLGRMDGRVQKIGTDLVDMRANLCRVRSLVDDKLDRNAELKRSMTGASKSSERIDSRRRQVYYDADRSYTSPLQ